MMKDFLEINLKENIRINKDIGIMKEVQRKRILSCLNLMISTTTWMERAI